MNEFNRDCISIKYPANWRIEADESDGGAWTVTVSSPLTAFAMLALRPDARDPADLADQTLDALKADYQELDAESVVETLSGRAAIGHNIDFLTVDTAITSRTRCLESPAGPVLLMTQVSEFDRERHEPVLDAIVQSLRIEEE